jgi:hypothetical protein
MQLILSQDELHELIYSALCNGGISELHASGLEIRYSRSEYQDAKQKLIDKDPTKGVCYEEVLMQMLRDGKRVYFKDMEGGEPDAELNFELAAKNLQNNKDAVKDILSMLDENDGGDAFTAWNVLQYAMLGELVYG